MFKNAHCHLQVTWKIIKNLIEKEKVIKGHLTFNLNPSQKKWGDLA
jgi:hypothetical protein